MYTPGQHIALGQRIPDSPHAVSVSLPCMADVIAYEEKEPRTLAKLRSGYPRFVRHAFIEEFTQRYKDGVNHPIEGQLLWFASDKAREDALKMCGNPGDVSPVEFEGKVGLVMPFKSESERKLSAYLQHTGVGLSSREAECLIGKKPLEVSETFNADYLKTQVEHWFNPRVKSDVFLCRSGMNACYGAFQAVNQLQKRHGRKNWISVGWLYLDTLQILEHFLEPGATTTRFENVEDTKAIIEHIAQVGNDVAGLFIEAPTNPLVQTPAIREISDACRAAGIMTIFDPSLVSPQTVDLSPYGDVICCSLTKYSGFRGDLMIGGISVNLETTHGPDLASITRELTTRPFIGDQMCLSESLKSAPCVNKQIQENTMELADFFQGCKSVEHVYWAYEHAFANAYRSIEREENCPGGVISLKLNKPIESVYDPIALPKGPSFGTEFTLITPYVHLAHYDLLVSEQGRRVLKRAGLCEDMIRVSVGVESIEELKDAFSEVLS
jgi:cystathionine gamma-synthase